MLRRISLLLTLLAGPFTAVGACESGSPSMPAADAGDLDAPRSIEDAAPCTELPLPDGGVVHVTGTVVEATHDDASTPKPIPDAMVAVEYGGLYLPWCDMSRASPYYVFGAVSDANGKFELDVKQGSLGFHGFATGYFYSRAALDTSAGTDVKIVLEKLPAGQGKPATTNVAFDQTTVSPGARVTFSATIATWDAKDPLSDENVLVEPTRSWGLELDPPSVGKKDDFPDGLWRRSFAAPDVPGTYTYWFSSTTANCVTSDLIRATLVVQ